MIASLAVVTVTGMARDSISGVRRSGAVDETAVGDAIMKGVEE